MFVPAPIQRIAARGVDAAFASVGLEVRRRSTGHETYPPPPLFDDSEEAVHVVRGGGHAAFRCPLASSVAYHGFGYGPGSWHPFVEAVRERRNEPERSYAGSVLEAYFEAWQPRNAWNAMLADPGLSPPAFERLPSYAFLLPWLALTPEERTHAAEEIIRSENRRHAGRSLSIADGYNQHGPVTREKGAIEYARLWRCHEWLARAGWDRSRGDITVTVLQRGEERRHLVLHGHHRAAAAGALGFEAVPARLGTPACIDAADIAHWPQVRRQVWSRDAARRYVDHLFDFDAADWAARWGLHGASRAPGAKSGSW